MYVYHHLVVIKYGVVSSDLLASSYRWNTKRRFSIRQSYLLNIPEDADRRQLDDSMRDKDRLETCQSSHSTSHFLLLLANLRYFLIFSFVLMFVQHYLLLARLPLPQLRVALGVLWLKWGNWRRARQSGLSSKYPQQILVRAQAPKLESHGHSLALNCTPLAACLKLIHNKWFVRYQ